MTSTTILADPQQDAHGTGKRHGVGAMIRSSALYDPKTRHIHIAASDSVTFEMRVSQARECISDSAIRRLAARPDEWLTVYRQEGIRLA